MALAADAGQHPPSAHQLRSFEALPFETYGTFYLSALMGLVTLIFDL